MLREEIALIEVADRVGFKYAWASEHHFLDEYSHLSASEAFMAFALARTKNIHIGSGIINITPNVSPPSRVAEKVAMLDPLGQGRFEWGTGRGSSSTEVFGFNIDSMDVTREMYDETLPEIIKMMGAIRTARALGLQLMQQGYVKAAQLRGESGPAIIVRELLPSFEALLADLHPGSAKAEVWSQP